MMQSDPAPASRCRLISSASLPKSTVNSAPSVTCSVAKTAALSMESKPKVEGQTDAVEQGLARANVP